MPVRRLVLFLVFAATAFTRARAEEIPLTGAQQEFRQEIAAMASALQARNTSATAGPQGWFFLTNEIRFLAQGRFWGSDAAGVARSSKAPDPLPAIVDFHRQLRERGIELLVVPVPPKAAIYPDQLGVQHPVAPTDAAPQLQEFYRELQTRGVEVLDLTARFAERRGDAAGPVYCKTDSHWSGVGCTLAAQAIAERIRAKAGALPARKDYPAESKQVAIIGDLAGLVLSGKRGPEDISIRAVSDPATGGAVQADPNSPVLVLGDSHTLVFHEFLAERAGLVDQLAHELGFAPDLIGTRGSGATAVRISLYRKTRSDPGYLAKKKVVIWCFAAREFTEADQGWVPQPVGK